MTSPPIFENSERYQSSCDGGGLEKLLILYNQTLPFYWIFWAALLGTDVVFMMRKSIFSRKKLKSFGKMSKIRPKL